MMQRPDCEAALRRAQDFMYEELGDIDAYEPVVVQKEKPKPRPVPLEKANRIAELYRAGLNVIEVARKSGTSNRTVSAALRQLGIAIRKNGQHGRLAQASSSARSQ